MLQVRPCTPGFCNLSVDTVSLFSLFMIVARQYDYDVVMVEPITLSITSLEAMLYKLYFSTLSVLIDFDSPSLIIAQLLYRSNLVG
jgi:hypothetical protein